jgi:hypothetical protein
MTRLISLRNLKLILDWFCTATSRLSIAKVLRVQRRLENDSGGVRKRAYTNGDQFGDG